MSEPVKTESKPDVTGDNKLLPVNAPSLQERETLTEAIKHVEPSTEPKVEPVKEEPKKGEPVQELPKDPLSRSWAAIKTAEQQNKRARDEMRREKVELQRLKEQVDSLTKNNTDIATTLKQDPLGTLTRLGINFEDVARQVIEGKTSEVPKQEPKDREEVAQLRKEMELMRHERILDDYRGNARKVLQDPKFALLATHPKAVDDIMEYASIRAKDYGEVLQPEEIADTLQEVYEGYLKATLSHEVVRKLIQPGNVTSDEETPEEKSAKSKPAQTEKKKKSLTNDLSAPPTPQKDEDGNELSSALGEQELLRQAAALIPADVWDKLSNT